MSQLDPMLQGLGTAAGMSSAIEFNEEGVASFDVDGKLILHFEKVKDGAALQIYSAIGLVPAINAAEFYRRALEANLFGGSTAGSVLAIDKASNELILSQLVHPAAVSHHAFVELLDAFIQVAFDWQEKLRANRWELPKATAQASAQVSAPQTLSASELQAQFMNRA